MSRFERKEETREVKRFLTKMGYLNVKVSHGRGTAWGWLDCEVNIHRPKECYCEFNKYGQIETCHFCRDEYGRHYSLLNKEVMNFTGRSGDYGGNINYQIGWIEPVKEKNQGTEGQDRENYTDNQDRQNYMVH